MKISIGCDPAGYNLKLQLVAFLEGAGHSVTDVGCDSTAPADYPVVARKVADSVVAGDAERGILICGTGQGMAMAANKVRGARAALCIDPLHAVMSREHNDSNILCFGEWVFSYEQAVLITRAWLFARFSGGDAHKSRISMMDQLV